MERTRDAILAAEKGVGGGLERWVSEFWALTVTYSKSAKSEKPYFCLCFGLRSMLIQLFLRRKEKGFLEKFS